MMASYIFSRTLTPITIGLLLKNEHHGEPGNNWFARFFAAFERRFEAMREAYTDILTGALTRRLVIPCIAVVVLALGGTLGLFVGRDFFPDHRRRPDPASRQGAGRHQDREDRADFRGGRGQNSRGYPGEGSRADRRQYRIAARSYNYAFGDGTATGVNDGVISVDLKEDHAPTATYIKKLRQLLPQEFPENIFYFQPADMVTQILNFGIPSQINVRTVGYNRANNLRIAQELRGKIAALPGVADVHLQQEINGPEFFAQIDRAAPLNWGSQSATSRST